IYTTIHTNTNTAGMPNETSYIAIHITLNPHGLMHFIEKAYALMGRPEAAVLWFSEEKNSIAVSPAHPRVAGAFPFTGHAQGARLNALPFCRRWNITIDRAQKFLDPDFDESGIVHLDPKHTAT